MHDPFLAKKQEEYYQSCPRFGPLFGQETRKELPVMPKIRIQWRNRISAFLDFIFIHLTMQ